MTRYRQAEADLLGFLAEQARQAAARLGEDPDSAAVAAAMRASAAEHLVAINTLRQLAGQAKRGYVTGWVRQHVAAGEKVMVAAHHRDEVDAYAAAFGGLKLQGGQPVTEKEAVKARFQSQPPRPGPGDRRGDRRRGSRPHPHRRAHRHPGRAGMDTRRNPADEKTAAPHRPGPRRRLLHHRRRRHHRRAPLGGRHRQAGHPGRCPRRPVRHRHRRRRQIRRRRTHLAAHPARTRHPGRRRPADSCPCPHPARPAPHRTSRTRRPRPSGAGNGPGTSSRSTQEAASPGASTATRARAAPSTAPKRPATRTARLASDREVARHLTGIDAAVAALRADRDRGHREPAHENRPDDDDLPRRRRIGSPARTEVPRWTPLSPPRRRRGACRAAQDLHRSRVRPARPAVSGRHAVRHPPARTRTAPAADVPRMRPRPARARHRLHPASRVALASH